MKKKILLLAISLCLGVSTLGAETTYFITDLDMQNFWSKIAVKDDKVYSIAQRIMIRNKIDKRVPLLLVSKQVPNATTNTFDKQINVYTGILNLIKTDDELAYIIAHEIAHAVESYGGPIKLFAMTWNSKTYELKSDLKAIDYMVAAGYDPISAIIMGNKLFSEPLWDWGFLSTHPKGSKRLLAMYKYIYKKYPQYLNSEKTNNVYYKNFEYALADELKAFHHKESVRRKKQQKRGDL